MKLIISVVLLFILSPMGLLFSNENSIDEKKKVLFVYQTILNPDFLETLLFSEIEKILNYEKKVIVLKKTLQNKTQLNFNKESESLNGIVFIDIKIYQDSYLIQANIQETHNKTLLYQKEQKILFNQNIESEIKDFSKIIAKEILKYFSTEPKKALIEIKEMNDKYKFLDTKAKTGKSTAGEISGNSWVNPGVKYAFYGGISWQGSGSYLLNNQTVEQKTDPGLGFTVMGESIVNNFSSYSLTLNYLPFKRTSPILDSSQNNYGNMAFSHSVDLLPGAQLYWKTQNDFWILRLGAVLKAGVNFTRIGIEPKDSVYFLGQDTETYYYSGYKVQFGLFADMDYFLEYFNFSIPIFFEFLYQVGSTEKLNHNSFAVNLMIKVLSF